MSELPAVCAVSNFKAALADLHFVAACAPVLRFADQSKYPNMKYVTFIAHGGGAQLIQRWAVLGKDNPAPGRIQLR